MLTYARCLAGLHRHYFMVSPPPLQEAGGIFTPNCQVKQLRFRQLNGLSQGNRCANPGSMTQGHQEARLERVWEGWDTLGAGELKAHGSSRGPATGPSDHCSSWILNGSYFQGSNQPSPNKSVCVCVCMCVCVCVCVCVCARTHVKVASIRSNSLQPHGL